MEIDKDSGEDSNAEIAPTDDQSYLLSFSRRRKNRLPFCTRLRHLWHASWRFRLSVVGALTCLLVAAGVGIYIAFTTCWWFTNCRQLTIMSMNAWGMPASFGSQFKESRMKAIANEISKGKYDIYLLQELWMQPDHSTIAAAVPPGYYMTGFRELALADCDGRVSPLFCSGLSIITRDLDIVEKEFQSYTYHGDILRSWVDGEYLARKGVARLRIRLPLYAATSVSSNSSWWSIVKPTYSNQNITLDLFTTHTAAEPPAGYNYSNAYYRDRQVEELVSKYLNKSDADLVIFGADINAAPINEPGEPYHMIRQIMTNCIEEFFYTLVAWLNPAHATYGNAENTFSYSYPATIIDYIFYKVNRPGLHVFTSVFELPLFKFMYEASQSISTPTSTDAPVVSENGADGGSEAKGEAAIDEQSPLELSFSDHEAVTAVIHIWAVNGGAA